MAQPSMFLVHAAPAPDRPGDDPRFPVKRNATPREPPAVPNFATGPVASLACLAFVLLAGLLFATGARADFEPVARPDSMEQFMLADVDVHRGAVRVLYQTLPSLPQATQPGWTVNVYVALLGADGSVENRRIATGQRRYASLVLRRGADEVYVLPAPEETGEETWLERRSLADGSVVARIEHPWIARARGENHTVYPAADGGVFLTQQSRRSSRSNEPVSLAWTKFAPTGAVAAEGRFLEPTGVAMLAGVFPVDGGGLGMTVSLSHRGGDGHLATDIPSPIVAEVGGRRLEAWAFSETRALATGPGGAARWVSPALERQLMWEGEMSIPDTLPMNEIIAQNNEQMALMARTALEYAGERQIEHQPHWGFDQLKAAGDGWGMLARQAADRRLEPPMHGTWYLVLGAEGDIARRVRLEAQAEAMDARFERFLPAPGGGLVVAGRLDRGNRLHATALDAEGVAQWTVGLDARGLQFDDIAGDPGAPWLFGHGWDDAAGRVVLHVAQVDPSLGRPPGAPPAPEPRAARPGDAPTPASTAMPEFEPIEACECSCEEFERLRGDMEKAENLAPEQQMALMSDPDFLARMECMGSCAMQYAACGR